IAQKRGRIKMSLTIPIALRTLAANQYPRSVFNRIGHLALDLVTLHRRVQGTNNHTLLETVPHAQLLHLRSEFLDELIVDAIKEVEPLYSETGLAAVEKPSYRSSTDGIVEVGVVTHNHWITTAKFESDALHVLRRHFHDVLACRCSAGESDL